MKISIPQPCHENWQQMTPNEQGRFCASCQKTVVDFTDWTDKAIFDFFTLQKGKTCGRFNRTQIDRVISIPATKSRAIYRIAIAFAAVSLFSQAPMVYAQKAATRQSPINKKQTAKPNLHISLEGTIKEKNGKPLADVSIKLIDYQLKQVAHTTTDSKGRYALPSLKPHMYTIEIIPKDTTYAIQTDIIAIRNSEPIAYNAVLMLKSEQNYILMGDPEPDIAIDSSKK